VDGGKGAIQRLLKMQLCCIKYKYATKLRYIRTPFTAIKLHYYR
jgi:hypothetical protein